MTEKHTPGPWEIVYRDDDHCMCMTVIAAKGSMGNTRNVMRLRDDPNQANVIAITFHQLIPWSGQDAFNNDQSKANDRLIAAAPELLEALRYARRFVNESCDIHFIDQIIAKATGEKQ
ncbi:MAG: hypothetical protein ACXV9R_10365 [Methylobacter sp.]